MTTIPPTRVPIFFIQLKKFFSFSYFSILLTFLVSLLSGFNKHWIIHRILFWNIFLHFLLLKSQRNLFSRWWWILIITSWKIPPMLLLVCLSFLSLFSFLSNFFSFSVLTSSPDVSTKWNENTFSLFCLESKTEENLSTLFQEVSYFVSLECTNDKLFNESRKTFFRLRQIWHFRSHPTFAKKGDKTRQRNFLKPQPGFISKVVLNVVFLLRLCLHWFQSFGVATDF